MFLHGMKYCINWAYHFITITSGQQFKIFELERNTYSLITVCKQIIIIKQIENSY